MLRVFAHLTRQNQDGAEEGHQEGRQRHTRNLTPRPTRGFQHRTVTQQNRRLLGHAHSNHHQQTRQSNENRQVLDGAIGAAVLEGREHAESRGGRRQNHHGDDQHNTDTQGNITSRTSLRAGTHTQRANADLRQAEERA